MIARVKLHLDNYSPSVTLCFSNDLQVGPFFGGANFPTIEMVSEKNDLSAIVLMWHLIYYRIVDTLEYVELVCLMKGAIL